MAVFRLRKSGGGSTLRGGDTLQALAVTLVGDVEAVAVAAGTVEQTHSLAVAVDAVVQTVGNAEQTHALVVTVDAVVETASTPEQTHALTVDVEAVAVATGTLEEVEQLTGAVDAVASVTAAATQTHQLTADIQTVASVVGVGSQVHALTADVGAVASMTAVLTVSGDNPLTGAVDAVVVTTAALEQTHALIVAVDAVGSTTGVLTVTTKLVGSVEAVAAITAAVEQVHALTGSVQAVAVASGALEEAEQLTGSVEAVAQIVGTPTQIHQLSNLNPGYVTLDGTSDQITTPDDPKWTPSTGDLGLRIDVAPEDGTPEGSNEVLMSHYRFSGDERSYFFRLTTTGRIQLGLGNTDGTFKELFDSALLNLSDRTRIHLRVDYDGDDGAGNRVVKFFTRTDVTKNIKDDVGWVQLGSTITRIGTFTAFHNSTDLLRVGSSFTGRFTGNIYQAAFIVDDVLQADPDFRDDVQGWSSPPGTDDEGNVWTFVAAAAWIPPHGSAAIAEATGSFEQVHQLAGAVASVATVTAALDVTVPLTGTVSSVASATATVVQVHRLTGATSGVAVVTATLDVTVFVTGTAQAVAVTTAVLTVSLATTKGFNGVDDALVGSLALNDALVGAVGLADASVGSMGVDDD